MTIKKSNLKFHTTLNSPLAEHILATPAAQKAWEEYNQTATARAEAYGAYEDAKTKAENRERQYAAELAAAAAKGDDVSKVKRPNPVDLDTLKQQTEAVLEARRVDGGIALRALKTELQRIQPEELPKAREQALQARERVHEAVEHLAKTVKELNEHATIVGYWVHLGQHDELPRHALTGSDNGIPAHVTRLLGHHVPNYDLERHFRSQDNALQDAQWAREKQQQVRAKGAA